MLEGRLKNIFLIRLYTAFKTWLLSKTYVLIYEIHGKDFVLWEEVQIAL